MTRLSNMILGRLPAFLLTGFAMAACAVDALADYVSPPFFAAAEQSGDLAPIEERLPANPAVATMYETGRHGGEIRMLMASARDTRIMVAYAYARLVCYDRNYQLVPDILESLDVEEGRVFTLHLREGHKWSNGKDFTTEDFRYWWEDVANNPELSPAGPPKEMLVDGKPPLVEVIDETTIRYSWEKPNAAFLPALAQAQPLYIYRPSKYLKKMHAKYADPAELEAAVADSGQQDWAALHNRKGNQYRNDNPKLPTLDPWVLRVKPPAERFVFVRNPYYHRVDANGLQLPYADQVIFDIADGKLIPAKTGAGESDLQARNIRFDNYTFLKKAEKQGKFRLLLWNDGRGSNFALYPNLNANDEAWRNLNRDVRFRRALSLAIDRHEINQVIYFGLGSEGGNAVLPMSPLYKESLRNAWSQFDLKAANALLDEIGLQQYDDDGYRLLPDGRRMTIVVDTAGESTEESDILELIKDGWRELGIDMFTKPSQREVFRDRVFAGESIMSAWFGVDNGFPNADMAPVEFTPSTQQQLMWPKWGQYLETAGASGEPVDLPEAKELAGLLDEWRLAAGTDERTRIWDRILTLWSDQVYSIGTIADVPQPVVVAAGLHNVPDKAIWAFEPGGHFGVYKPDSFWFEQPRALSPTDDPYQ